MSSKINALRQVIMTQLQTLPGATYHRRADPEATYPYKVYSLQRIDLGDLSRNDVDLCIDIWDRGQDPKRAEDITCQVVDLLAAANLPQDTILPTIYRSDAYQVDDPDRELIHYQLHFTVQTYERR